MSGPAPASDSDQAGQIPPSHQRLLECPPVAALTTFMPTGYPQTSVVWCDHDGHDLLINTMRGFAKERNMRHEPQVSVLCFDPQRPDHYLVIEGLVVDMTEEGASAHLDGLASKYAGHPVRFFGDVVPACYAEAEIPVLCRVRPVRALAVEGPPPSTPEGGTDAIVPEVFRAAVDIPIPMSHLELLSRPIPGVVSTIGGDGVPHQRLADAECASPSSMILVRLDALQMGDITANQRVSVLVVDPANTSRFIEVRGDAELVSSDGTCRIHARRITLDAIHS